MARRQLRLAYRCVLALALASVASCSQPATRHVLSIETSHESVPRGQYWLNPDKFRQPQLQSTLAKTTKLTPSNDCTRMQCSKHRFCVGREGPLVYCYGNGTGCLYACMRACMHVHVRACMHAHMHRLSVVLTYARTQLFSGGAKMIAEPMR